MKLTITLAGVLFLVAYSYAATCGGDSSGPTEDNPCDTEADVVMLFDSSSSILVENYAKQFEWTKSLMRRFVIGSSVRFGAVIFSHTTELLFHLNEHLDIASLETALTGVPYLDSSTYMHSALMSIDYWNMWSEENGGRPTASKFLIIVTDGNPNRLSSAYTRANVIKEQGITIMGVAVGDLIFRDVIANIASTPSDVFEVDDYDALPSIEQMVAARTCDGNDGTAPTCMSGYIETETGQCEDVNECALGICAQNCENTEGSYICSCNEGYVVNSDDTDQCDESESCHHEADILLVFDASSSVLLENFVKQTQVAKNFVSEVGIENAVFGAVVFSRLTKLVFDLGDYTDLNDLHSKLDGMVYENSSTYLHTCFTLIDYWDMFNPQVGYARDGVPDSIILFTDGNPNRVNDAENAAQVLKDNGITIVGVPIGPDIDLEITSNIVSSPSDNYIVSADGFDTLQYVNQRLASIVCG